MRKVTMYRRCKANRNRRFRFRGWGEGEWVKLNARYQFVDQDGDIRNLSGYRNCFWEEYPV